MIKIYENFEELVLSYAELFSSLTDVQADLAPQVFNSLVDSCFKMYNNDLRLFLVRNNYKQSINEAKFSSSLFRKNWKSRLRENIYFLNPDLKPPAKKKKLSFKEKIKARKEAKKLRKLQKVETKNDSVDSSSVIKS